MNIVQNIILKFFNYSSKIFNLKKSGYVKVYVKDFKIYISFKKIEVYL
jgi:hypothetical protein